MQQFQTSNPLTLFTSTVAGRISHLAPIPNLPRRNVAASRGQACDSAGGDFVTILLSNYRLSTKT